MRIGVYDPSGCGLGFALGFADLGHEVAYEGPSGWYAAAAPNDYGTDYGARLARLTFGDRRSTLSAANHDLMVVVDVFADFLGEMVPYMQADRRQLSDPPSWVMLYPERLHRALELAGASGPAIVVDRSDNRLPREIAFENLDDVTLFARECPLTAPTAWRPLPFLWNSVLLWLERTRSLAEWYVPANARQRRVDWSFCGTLDHPRYQGQRRRALAYVARDWPHLRGKVHDRLSFAEILMKLQEARVGLNLPGAGELCFRLHECLAVGVPAWHSLPLRVEAPSGLETVLSPDPERLFGLSPDYVREVYDERYSPRAAARLMLDAANAPLTEVTARRAYV